MHMKMVVPGMKIRVNMQLDVEVWIVCVMHMGMVCHWNKTTCEYAAEYGHLDCLRYAHENGCHWDEVTCIRATNHGNLDCLRYAHENGCPWNETTCYNAARSGYLECFALRA